MPRLGISLCSLTALLALAATAPAPAHADGQPPRVVAIEGTFGFDQMSPRTSKCAKVRGALLRKLKKGYVCAPPEAGTASGKPAVAICEKAKRSSYLLFTAAADCKEERETQLANGE